MRFKVFVSLLVACSWLPLSAAEKHCYQDEWLIDRHNGLNVAKLQCLPKEDWLAKANEHCEEKISSVTFPRSTKCRRDHSEGINFLCCSASSDKTEKNVTLMGELKSHFSNMLKEIYFMKKNLKRISDENYSVAKIMFSSSNINVPFTFIGVNKTHIKKNLANIVLYPWDLGRFELHKILHANEKYGIDMRTPSGRFIEVCSIRESWKMLDRRLDLFAALSIDSLISELVEILLELPRASVGRGNIFDYPYVTDWCVPQLKSGAGFEARSNQYWKDNFLVHLWFIPNSDLSIILQRKENLSESILQYYRKNIINVVEKQFATEQSSDQYGSVSSVVGIFLAFVIGSSVTLVVLKTLERRKCPKLTASNPISVMYVKDSS